MLLNRVVCGDQTYKIKDVLKNDIKYKITECNLVFQKREELASISLANSYFTSFSNK